MGRKSFCSSESRTLRNKFATKNNLNATKSVEPFLQSYCAIMDQDGLREKSI